MIERFVRSLKKACVWQHRFGRFGEAARVIHPWIRWYNEQRPHQALGYRSPVAYRTQRARETVPEHARTAEGGTDTGTAAEPPESQERCMLFDIWGSLHAVADLNQLVQFPS